MHGLRNYVCRQLRDEVNHTVDHWPVRRDAMDDRVPLTHAPIQESVELLRQVVEPLQRGGMSPSHSVQFAQGATEMPLPAWQPVRNRESVPDDIDVADDEPAGFVPDHELPALLDELRISVPQLISRAVAKVKYHPVELVMHPVFA